MKKSNFFIFYLAFIFIYIGGFLYFTFLPLNLDSIPLPNFIDNQITKATLSNLNLIFLAFLVYTVIEGQFFWNRFTKKQLDTIEKLRSELELKNIEIIDSIKYAKRIQTAILPTENQIKDYFPSSFVFYKPKDIVAGDFYWYSYLDDNAYLAAADCTGHGVPGAMVSVICNSGLNRSVNEFGMESPAEILNKTRELLLQEFEKSDAIVADGMDISLCSLNYKSKVLEWAGANNTLWLIRAGSAVIEEIKPDKQPIGHYESSKPFTNHQIHFGHDDTIYMFSDGFQDQFGGEKGKKFMAKSFKAFLLEIKDERMTDQSRIIENKFNNWKGDYEQVDDVCIIGIRL